MHTAEHLASAMFYLGAARCEIPRARLFAEPFSAVRPYAVIHPFASAPDKTWPVDRFITVANQLREHAELEPLILCGPGDDPDPFASFTRLARRAALAREIGDPIGVALHRQ